MLIEFIKPDFQFNDERGVLVQLIHKGWSQVNYVSSKNNSTRGGHYHKNNKEAFYVISGNFKLVVEDADGIKEEYSIKAGDFFVVKPFVIHSFKFELDTTLISFYDKGVEEGFVRDIHQL
jgi:oxalate decarboxylase/phosphoglucose isomerase-like protein (cupin superfamily)